MGGPNARRLALLGILTAVLLGSQVALAALPNVELVSLLVILYALLLGRQVFSPVLWQQSMRCLIGEGVDTFIEIGPGKTLSNFMKKIDGSVKMYHIEKPEDLRAVLAQTK